MRHRILFNQAGDGSGGGGGGGNSNGGSTGSGDGQSGSSSGSNSNGNAGNGASGASGSSGSGGVKDQLFGDGKGGSDNSGGSNSGGDGKSGAGNNASNNTNGAANSNSVVIPANWKDALPQELKDAAFMKLVEDVPTLAKNYANVQKMVGADKVPIPTKNATTEDWKEAFHKLGNPRDINEYKIELDKESSEGMDPEFLEQFKVQAHKNGILPRQSTELARWFAEINKKANNDAATTFDRKQNDEMTALHNSWGAAKEQNTVQAKAAITEYCTKEEQDYLRSIGMGKSAKFMSVMAKIGASLSEDKIRGAGGTTRNAFTPEQAQSKIKEIQSAGPKHAYFDKNHEKHQEAKKEMDGLFAMAYPPVKSS